MIFKAGFIGIGNMGGALCKAVCNAINGANTAVFDLSEDRIKEFEKKLGTAYFDSARDLAKSCRYVFLGVKPDIIKGVAEGIKEAIHEDTVIVTMAAGISIDTLSPILGTHKIIRIMPNTPASVGQGMILYCKDADVTEEEEKDFLEMMGKCGVVMPIGENKIDAAAAISGCGPAYVYMFIEALADGGVKCGLPRSAALLLAKQTVLGSAAMTLAAEEHPEGLKDNVCSPGGTTIEGVLTLERSAFRATVADAVISAYEKTAKLK